MKKYFLIISLALIFHSCSFAATTTTDPVDNAGSARSLGMGRAYVAVSDDADAVFINQAGLGGVKALNLTGMYYSKVFGSYYYAIGSGAMPTPYGTFGLGFIGSGSGDLTDTRDPDNLKSFSNYDDALVLAYGTSIPRVYGEERRFFVGGGLKFFTRGYSGSVTKAGTGMNMDLGIKYIPVRWISLGVFKHNVLPGSAGGIHWDTGTEEELDSPLKVGAAVRLFDNRQIVALDLNSSSHPQYPTTMHFGTEYKATENFAVRGGLDQTIDDMSSGNTSWNVALGLGLYYAGFRVDYAYHPYFNYSDNVTHYISISYTGEPSGFNIRHAASSPDFSVLKNLPGRIYDDLGNVIAYEPMYVSSNKELKLRSRYLITPISAEVPDWEKLYLAYIYSDIKSAIIERQSKRYWRGDIIPVIASAPLDIETLTVFMPNGDEIQMTFDGKTKVWHGVWRVPEDFKEGQYTAKVIAYDFEGYKIEAKTTAFFVGEVAEGEAQPEELQPVVAKEEKPATPGWEDVMLLIEGYLGRKLGPDQKISRSEMTYIVARAKSYELENAINRVPFPDVSGKYWAIRTIVRCFEDGIVIGYPDKTFKPDRIISFGELLAIVSRMDGLSDPGIKAFREHWARTYARASLSSGILKLEDKPIDSDFSLIPMVKEISILLSRTETLKKALRKV